MSEAKYAAVGGQAVMEGIMMKSPKKSILAVRKPDGEIAVEPMKSGSVRDRHKILRLPIIRGVVSFVESLVVGYRSLMRSAELAGLEEETNGNKFLTGLLTAISGVLGVGLAVGLFMLLPQFLGGLVERVVPLGGFRTLLEGLVRIALFLLYIVLTSLMKDIRTLYRYHGAEHKTIFCFEAKEELTVENVRKQSRLHPRCGTSFIFLVFLISILFFSVLHLFLPPMQGILRFAVHLVLLPLVAGISFEVLQYTGRHDGTLVRILSAPGKQLQRITTAEPTDEQIEVAIVALRESLTDKEGEYHPEWAYRKAK